MPCIGILAQVLVRADVTSYCRQVMNLWNWVDRTYPGADGCLLGILENSTIAKELCNRRRHELRSMDVAGKRS